MKHAASPPDSLHGITRTVEGERFTVLWAGGPMLNDREERHVKLQADVDHCSLAGDRPSAKTRRRAKHQRKRNEVFAKRVA